MSDNNSSSPLGQPLCFMTVMIGGVVIYVSCMVYETISFLIIGQFQVSLALLKNSQSYGFSIS